MAKLDGLLKQMFAADPSEPAKKKKKRSDKRDKQNTEMNGNSNQSEVKKGILKESPNPYVVQVIARPGQSTPRPNIFKRSNNEQLKTSDSVSDFFKSKKINVYASTSGRFTNSLNLAEKSPELEEQTEKIQKRLEKTIVIDDTLPETIILDNDVPPEPVKKSSPSKNEDVVKKPKRKDAIIHAYQVPHKNAFILHIKHPSEFSLMGKMRFTLLVGIIDVFGWTIEEQTVYDLYLPKFSSCPVMETQIPINPLNIEELESYLLRENLITENNMKKLLNDIKPYDSVALIEDVTSNFVHVFEKYSDKKFFSDLPALSLPEVSQSMHCTFNLNNSNAVKEFRKNPAWGDLVLGNCNFICGGKNVGKSSLMKYLINKSKLSADAVVCLDLDPGQPEFCPPGCLAVTVIRNPVIGPNFVHCIEPEKMVFYGEINVVQQPIGYLEAVKFIIDYYRNDPVLSQMPCYVNSMGFCKGLGVAITVSVIKLLRPSSIIQIKSSDNKNNFPYNFTPECLKFSQDHLFNIPDTSDFNYDFNLIDSYAEEDGVQTVGGLKPRELRDLKFLSYFSQMVTPEKPNFNFVQPFSIQFSELYLAVQGAVSPSEILKAFNGNMVALCQYKQDLSDEFLEPMEKDYFKILTKPKVMPCLALGFVRGIDIAAKRIYVITHLSNISMELVNCLMLGFVTPPHSIYLKQDTVEGPIPYTSINSGDNVQMVKRTYKFPTRNQTS